MRFILIAAIMMFGYVGVYIGAVHMSKDRIVAELSVATQKRDKGTLENRLDFRKLQNFVRKDIQKKSRAVRGGDIPLDFGPKPDDIRVVVDHYIQPDMVDLIFDLYPQAFPEAKPVDFIREVAFHGPFAFSVLLGYPVGGEKTQMTMTEKMSTVKLVFRVRGWQWKAEEMHIPLFMMPKRIYTKDEILDFVKLPNHQDYEE